MEEGALGQGRDDTEGQGNTVDEEYAAFKLISTAVDEREGLAYRPRLSVLIIVEAAICAYIVILAIQAMVVLLIPAMIILIATTTPKSST